MGSSWSILGGTHTFVMVIVAFLLMELLLPSSPVLVRPLTQRGDEVAELAAAAATATAALAKECSGDAGKFSFISSSSLIWQASSMGT
jgi:hypothetical protein